MIKSSLKQAGVSTSHWCYAAQCAAYTLNRLHHSSTLGLTTPHEQFSCIKHDISAIVPFGAIGVKHLERTIRPKGGLGDSGIYVRMMGYDPRFKTYIVKTKTGKILRTRVTKWLRSTFRFPIVRVRGPPILTEGDGESEMGTPNLDRSTPTHRLSQSATVPRRPAGSSVPVSTPGEQSVRRQPDEQSVRRSVRKRKRPLRQGLIPWEHLSSLSHSELIFVTVNEILDVPSSYEEAISNHESGCWIPPSSLSWTL